MATGRGPGPGALLATISVIYAAIGFFTAASYALFMRLARGELAATRFAVFMAITFVVSTGPPPVPLPELNALDVAAATTALSEAGLVLGAQTPEFSEDVLAGLVIRWAVALQPNLVAGQEVIKAPRSTSWCRRDPHLAWCPIFVE